MIEMIENIAASLRVYGHCGISVAMPLCVRHDRAKDRLYRLGRSP
jgi:hypothetical protein